MKTDYGLRPSDVPEIEDLPRLARKAFGELDMPEQSYFRNNPSEMVKNRKLAKALLVHIVVAKLIQWRAGGVSWNAIQSSLLAEHGVSASVSTLKRWALSVG